MTDPETCARRLGIHIWPPGVFTVKLSSPVIKPLLWFIKPLLWFGGRYRRTDGSLYGNGMRNQDATKTL